MPKKQWTEEEKKAFGAKMKAAREAKNQTEDEVLESTDFKEPSSNDEILFQLKELRETNALLMKKVLQGETQGVEVGRQGNLVGEVDKYLIDPDNYPDPTPRLATEPRLKAVNFDFNYELDYEVSISAYETKSGVNMREPKFLIQLNRVVVNEQGEQTDKRYIARRLIFHEDPQAAIVIARENGLPVDQDNEKDFLDEMRYLRVRDWLFDIFWPKPASIKEGVREEVIGGTIVQVFTKSSEEPEEIPFDQLKTKVV